MATGKLDSLVEAVDQAKRNYGEEIDITALMESLEGAGWRYEE